MKNIKKQIQELINDSLVVELKSQSDVYIDSYEQGELENVNCYTNDTIKEVTNYDNLEKTIEELIVNCLNKYYFVDGDEYLNKDFICFDKCCGIYTDILVDNDNYPASDKEIELWKKGEIVLYNNNVNMKIFINGADITHLINDILKG